MPQPAFLDDMSTVFSCGMSIAAAKRVANLMAQSLDSLAIAKRMEMSEAEAVRYMHCIRESRRRRVFANG